jgi:hypothetical protein
MNNVGKNWDETEEDKLIEEINKLVNINKICEKHQRQVGGVKARIKKLLDDPVKSNKLTNIASIIITYFGESTDRKLTKEEYVGILKNIKANIHKYNCIGEIILENNIDEYQIKKILEKINEKEEDTKIKKKINKLLNNKNEQDNIQDDNTNTNANTNNQNNISNEYENIIISNLLDFDSVFTIKKVFTQLEISEIKSILKKYLKSDNMDSEKKSRIKFILKKYKISNEEDYYDKEFDAEKVKKKIFSNISNNLNNQKNNLQSKVNFVQNSINNTSNQIINYGNQDIILVLNEIINQIKNIKSDVNNINAKIDFIYKNTSNITNITNIIGTSPNKTIGYNKTKSKDKNIISKNEESEEDLENELNKYI